MSRFVRECMNRLIILNAECRVIVFKRQCSCNGSTCRPMLPDFKLFKQHRGLQQYLLFRSCRKLCRRELRYSNGPSVQILQSQCHNPLGTYPRRSGYLHIRTRDPLVKCFQLENYLLLLEAGCLRECLKQFLQKYQQEPIDSTVIILFNLQFILYVFIVIQELLNGIEAGQQQGTFALCVGCAKQVQCRPKHVFGAASIRYVNIF